jgi:hypothetical protein
LVLVALVGSDHKRGTVKKVCIHLKSANVVITPSEGGIFNIVCCGIFRYPFPFGHHSNIGVQSNFCSGRTCRCMDGFVAYWNDNESFCYVL